MALLGRENRFWGLAGLSGLVAACCVCSTPLVAASFRPPGRVVSDPGHVFVSPPPHTPLPLHARARVVMSKKWGWGPRGQKRPPFRGGVFVPRVCPRATSNGGGAAGAAPHPRRTPARGCIMDHMSGLLVRVRGPVGDRDALHTMVSVLGYVLEWVAAEPQKV
nr:MAG TPA: hypothetical protein [Caudoviricetes sp.]